MSVPEVKPGTPDWAYDEADFLIATLERLNGSLDLLFERASYEYETTPDFPFELGYDVARAYVTGEKLLSFDYSVPRRY
jgi:hypothetical protein